MERDADGGQVRIEQEQDGVRRELRAQERGAPDARYSQTYYQLGNTYRAAGNLEKARKVFARGLEVFPEDKQLKEQLELLDKK